MARTVSTEYVCDNCMHRVVMPGVSNYPIGWHEISSFGNIFVLVCSLNCLHDVVQHWLDNSIALEKKEESAQRAVDDNEL